MCASSGWSGLLTCAFGTCPRPHRWVDRGAHWEAPACDCDSAELHDCPDVLDSITREQWQQHHRVCALPHLPEAKGKPKARKALLHWGKGKTLECFPVQEKITLLFRILVPQRTVAAAPSFSPRGRGCCRVEGESTAIRNGNVQFITGLLKWYFCVWYFCKNGILLWQILLFNAFVLVKCSHAALWWK